MSEFIQSEMLHLSEKLNIFDTLNEEIVARRKYRSSRARNYATVIRKRYVH